MWQYTKSTLSRRFTELEKYYIMFEDFFFNDCTFNVTTDGCVIKKDPSSSVFIREKIPRKIYSNIIDSKNYNWASELRESRLAQYRLWTIIEIILLVQRAHTVYLHVLVYQNCLRLCNFLRKNTASEITKANFKFIDIALRADRNSEIVQ